MNQYRPTRSGSNRKRHGRRTEYTEYTPDRFRETCIICGHKHIDSGRIFHGQCVCDECVEYMLNLPGESDESRSG